MRYLAKILVLTACLIALSGVAAACDCECKEPLTQGYWKNHPGAWVDRQCILGDPCILDIGGEELNSMDILNQPVKGDARIILAHQLIAARLNIENGACPDDVMCIISKAENWLACQKDKVSPSSCPEAIAWAEELDKFNNGE